MENNLIEESIKKGELQLDCRETFNHFSIVLYSFAFSIFIPMMVLFYELYDPTSNKNYGVIWFSLLFVIVGLILYFIQKKRLKLTSIRANISRNEFDEIIRKICEKYGWQISTNKLSLIVAKTPFSGSSWGEQVTIIFDENNLLINSICDPDKQTSVVSYGKNSQNVRLLVKRINKSSITNGT